MPRPAFGPARSIRSPSRYSILSARTSMKKSSSSAGTVPSGMRFHMGLSQRKYSSLNVRRSSPRCPSRFRVEVQGSGLVGHEEQAAGQRGDELPLRGVDVPSASRRKA